MPCWAINYVDLMLEFAPKSTRKKKLKEKKGNKPIVHRWNYVSHMMHKNVWDISISCYSQCNESPFPLPCTYNLTSMKYICCLVVQEGRNVSGILKFCLMYKKSTCIEKILGISRFCSPLWRAGKIEVKLRQ